MTWMPVFKIGVWNAWMPMLVILLVSLTPFLLDMLKGDHEFSSRMGNVPVERSAQTRNTLSSILLVVLLLYSVFLPLHRGSAWCFAGGFIWLVGLIFCLSALITAAVTPAGQVFTRGAYRYSRHPLYVSLALVLLGVGIGAASWLFLLLSIIYIGLMFSFSSAEERECRELFGDVYDEYVQHTPRWLGWPRV